VGPNLDTARPPASLVVERVTNGLGGMPPFSGKLGHAQIEAVAAYVSTVAGQ
jgi:mono/diheme cytochrome c family protein